MKVSFACYVAQFKRNKPASRGTLVKSLFAQRADYFRRIDRSASWSSDLAGLSEFAQTLKSSRKYR
jgi:hypothetical protein